MGYRAVLVVSLAVAAGPGLSQEPAPGDLPAPPVFGVGVDLVAVDASVVGPDGRPVLGLGPADFRVEVDGRPRRVVSAEYVGREVEPSSPLAAPPAHFSSNETAGPGRLVLLLVDAGNIARGTGRHVFDAAARFVAGLPPSDRVGLAVVPGPGPSLDFTVDRRRVEEALGKLVGQGQVDQGVSRVPVHEAVALLVGHDRFQWERYVDVECALKITPDDLERCSFELEAEANLVLGNYRERSQRSRRALLAAMRGLAAIDGTKTVVLISEGLWMETVGEFTQIADAVAEAQASLYVLLLEKPGQDAEFGRGHVRTAGEEASDTGTLYDLAAASRGAVIPVSGTASAPFARLSRELTGFYTLGFEPGEGDRDGKSHSVDVETSRHGASVRARRLLNIPAAAPKPEEALVGTLRSPRVERGLVVRVATFATRASAGGGKVRVLIAAQVQTRRRPMGVGYVLSGADGKVVASRAYQGVSGGDGEWGEFVGELVVDPGPYQLRLAAVDASGRRGSVEHVVKAAPVSAGGVEVSDLVLGAAGAASGLRPSVDLELAGDGLAGLVELGGSDASRLARAEVAFEVADSAEEPALVRVPGRVSAPEADGARVARVSVAGGLLPPGEYSARAEVSVDGKVVAVVNRPFRVTPPRAESGRPGSPLASLLVEAPAFERGELLKPEPLLHFIDRAQAVVPGPAPPGVAAAIDEARAGRPEAMLERLAGAPPRDARVEYLRGVSSYARGDLRASQTQLQAALDRSSDMLPAAVYLGALHAASGQDLDAIGAWQTALITETGSPVLYGLLGDALVRAKEAVEAVSILGEGLAAFPESEPLRRRLVLAQAMGGQGEEALPLLARWIEEHPDDHPAVMATLALLFEGFAREAAGGTSGPERERLVSFARAYAEGEGPNRGVVERWLRYLETRDGG